MTFTPALVALDIDGTIVSVNGDLPGDVRRWYSRRDGPGPERRRSSMPSVCRPVRRCARTVR